MIITSKKITAILNRYEKLRELARDCIDSDNLHKYYSSIRFDENGNIEWKINTSCGCHPEYEWEMIKTRQQFEEWLIKNKHLS